MNHTQPSPICHCATVVLWLLMLLKFLIVVCHGFLFTSPLLNYLGLPFPLFCLHILHHHERRLDLLDQRWKSSFGVTAPWGKFGASYSRWVHFNCPSQQRLQYGSLCEPSFVPQNFKQYHRVNGGLTATELCWVVGHTTLKWWKLRARRHGMNPIKAVNGVSTRPFAIDQYDLLIRESRGGRKPQIPTRLITCVVVMMVGGYSLRQVIPTV